MANPFRRRSLTVYIFLRGPLVYGSFFWVRLFDVLSGAGVGVLSRCMFRGSFSLLCYGGLMFILYSAIGGNTCSWIPILGRCCIAHLIGVRVDIFRVSFSPVDIFSGIAGGRFEGF